MIRLNDVAHRYDEKTVVALPDLQVAQGEHQLVLGLSGSGKSTLLHIVAGVLTPTAGTVVVSGRDMHTLQGAALDRFRGQHIGIVFQQLHLLDTLTIVQNLLMAPYMAGLPQDRRRALALLEQVDLVEKADAYPHTLSAGQKQRAAIARAVMNNPDVLLADEPTASLDDERAGQVLDLLQSQAKAHNATLLIATHDARVKERFSSTYTLSASLATP